MKQSAPHGPLTHHQSRDRNTRPIRAGRWAAIAILGGGLATSALVAGTSGAAMDRTAKKVVVSVTKNASHGTILVSGTTLYTLKPSMTACTATCVKIWPELLLPKGVKKATAGSGIKASKLGTVHLADGAVQVTYGGKKLYWFSGDTSPGQVNGNVTDTWGKWTDVTTSKTHKASTATTSGGATAGTGGTAF
jgi:predicted lipoprotein with Yx(FWY)xxD motif